MKSKSVQNGFSLMEALIALTILSVVAGVAGISYKPTLSKYRMFLAKSVLVSRLEGFRVKSILKNRTYQLKVLKNEIYFRKKGSYHWSSWEKIQPTKSVEFFWKGSIYFYGAGFASPKTILLRSETLHQSVILNTNGRLRDGAE